MRRYRIEVYLPRHGWVRCFEATHVGTLHRARSERDKWARLSLAQFRIYDKWARKVVE